MISDSIRASLVNSDAAPIILTLDKTVKAVAAIVRKIPEQAQRMILLVAIPLST